MAPARHGRRGRESGAALLTVMVSVAVLTAVAVELAYSSRVSLHIAANARDELRAAYLARSGVAMGRLVLSFQQQLDEALPRGGAMPVPRVQVWNLVPVGSALVAGLFPGAPGAAPAAGAAAQPAGLHGGGGGAARGGPPSFTAKIEDEGRKVNAQLEGLAKTGDRKLWQQVQSVYQLVCDARYDALFDREDARGVRTTREELLVRLRDWVDQDERSSELVVAGGSGAAACAMIPGESPFLDAYGDENQPYDRGEERYRAKNARMDSLDELYLVAGVGDAFMEAFGDALTVYLKRDEQRNVNELDKRRLVELARIVADPPGQPALLEVEFADRLQKAVLERTLGGLLSLSPREFGALVELAGARVNANLLVDTNPNNPFTDRSTTFRIRSTGSAGVVSTTIDAVVRLEKAQAGDPVAAPGRLVHWRED